ncbi:MAG: methyl-accepting chemotaxis protein [Spirochaetales bacterium]
MKLSVKLYSAILTLMAGFLISVGFLIWTVTNAERLNDLSSSAQLAIRETNMTMRTIQNTLVTRDPLEDSYEEHLAQRERAQEAMEHLANHPEWHRLPPELHDRARGSLNVWNSIGDDFDNAEDGIETILEADLGGVHANGIMRLNRRLQDEENVDSRVVLRIVDVENTIDRAITSGADFIVNTLGEVVDTIALNAAAVVRQYLIISLAVTAAAILGGLLFVIVFTRRLSSRIRGLADVMDELAERNFTVEAHDRSNDEIGALSANVNRVIASTSEFFAAVQAAINQADTLQSELSASNEQSSSALNEITSNIESIQNRFTSLDKDIAGSAENIGSIDSSVQTLRDRIQGQAESMATVSSSIEEMNANVNSVTRLSQDRKRKADDLADTVREGADKVSGTNETIKSISHEIDDMLEIIEIINSVSEQTHLLSMNAAIESAHAGEAGRGFAVVAEEIRKLAESTSENAARIDRNLRDITDRIREAMQYSNLSSRSFEEIQEEVSGFSSALAEIYQSMQELAGGSNEVLGSSSEVAETTESITTDAKEMARRIDEIRRAMDSAAGLSREVSNGVDEIQRGSREILESMVAANETTKQNQERMSEVRMLLDTFHIFSKNDESKRVEQGWTGDRQGGDPGSEAGDTEPRAGDGSGASSQDGEESETGIRLRSEKDQNT